MSSSEMFARATEVVVAIRSEIGRAIFGQEETVEAVLTAFLAGGHVLIEGVPGLGKTLLVLAMARAIGGEFSRVQFTPDLMPSDVTGHAILDQNAREFRIRKGPVFANLLLADEINRAPAKTQAALLEVMQEQQVTIEGQAFELVKPFMTLATQNPIEQEGTYPLPEAQLDRFLMKVRMSYPTAQEERLIVAGVTTDRIGGTLDVSQIRQVTDLDGARQLQEIVAQVTVDERIIEYAVNLVRSTRTNHGLSIGAGPRGGIALVRAARARAIINGRDFVTPDDVRDIAFPALRHRVALSPELVIEGMDVDRVLESLLNSVEAPAT